MRRSASAGRLWIGVLICVLAAAALVGYRQANDGQKSSGKEPSSGEKGVTLRYGSADAKEAAVVQGLFAFKKYVEEASKGAIQVEPYINGVLGGDRELCEALQLGTVDLCIVMGGILANYDEAFNIFGLPYLWQSKEASYRAADGEFGALMTERAGKFGFKLLGYGDGGAYQIGNTGKTIASKADLKGLKLRVPEIDVDIRYFSALGATPTPISFSETYTALEQRVVNGLELPIELMYCSQYFDALDSITLSNHFHCLFPILMSFSAWDKLSPEQQKIVMDGIAKQVEVNRQVAMAAEAKYIKIFKDLGKTVHTMSDEAMNEFIAIGKTIQKEYESKIDPALIELARSYNH